MGWCSHSPSPFPPATIIFSNTYWAEASHAPDFCQDFWCDVSGCAADSIQRFGCLGGQSEVSQLERCAADAMVTHLTGQRSENVKVAELMGPLNVWV